ncbi:MAG: putative quinol monooxygenase [Acidobacteriaceae bacterium]
MISLTIRMKFKSEDREQIQEALCALTAASRLEPGCVSFIPHTLEDDPDIVFIYEQYRDQAARETHAASEHFQKHVVGCLYQRMLERQTENLHALA